MIDLVNGLFELIGAMLILLNVCQLYIDKEIKGITLFPVIFFTSWGVWNLWFYPSVDCWYSFTGGVAMVLANALWLGMAVYYGRK